MGAPSSASNILTPKYLYIMDNIRKMNEIQG
jgi:hypothetical protein